MNITSLTLSDGWTKGIYSSVSSNRTCRNNSFKNRRSISKYTLLCQFRLEAKGMDTKRLKFNLTIRWMGWKYLLDVYPRSQYG